MNPDGGGASTCHPATCAANSCGEQADGCGGLLKCGTCAAGQSCGGGGQPNVCGTGTCVPKTCASLGATCDSVSDGCGARLDCGGCPSGQTCGGGGQANVCGAPCSSASCPSGFTCGGSGACRGGDLGNLRFDIAAPRLVKVSGHIREGGKVPAADLDICRAVTFFPLAPSGEAGPGLSMAVTCDGVDAYSFEGLLPPGDYLVDVSQPDIDDLYVGYQSYAYEVRSKLSVTADVPNLILDLPARVSVKINLTQGGLAPRGNGSFFFTLESPRALLYARGVCNGTACSATVSPFADTYKLKISNFSATGPLPKQIEFAARPMLTGPLQLTYDLPAVYHLKGKVLLNGMTPPSTTISGCGELRFSPAGMVTEQAIDITCYAEATFDGYFIGGKGQLVADLQQYKGRVVDAQYSLTGDVLTAIFNVTTTIPAAQLTAGVVRKNGQALPPLLAGAGARCGTISFDSATGSGGFGSAALDCAWGFSLTLPAGSYVPEVTLTDPGAIQVLGAETARGAAVTLKLGSGNVVDVKPISKVAVGGYLVVNGVRPIEYGWGNCGTVRFEPLDRQANATSFPYICEGATGFTFSGQLEKGAYRVAVIGNANAATNIPRGRYVWKERLELTANNTGLRLDLPDGYAVYVAGTVQVNHAAPVLPPDTKGCGTLSFEEQPRGFYSSFQLSCGAPNPFSFAGRLPVGVYRVTYSFPVAKISEIAFDGSYVMTDRLEVK